MAFRALLRTPLLLCSVLVVAHAAAPRAHTNIHFSPSQCPLGDVDLFLVANEASFPLMQHLIHSIETFFPCFGALHVVVDDQQMVSKLPTWLDVDSSWIQIHTIDGMLPPDLRHMPGYILQQWVMMKADGLVRPSARHIMFFDCDVVFAVPVVRSLLFDERNRPYLGFWGFEYQRQFQESCESFLGNCTFGSAMSFFPFLYPKKAFQPMRDHLAKLHSAVDFDAAFGGWAKAVGPGLTNKFSQFVVMGNFIATFMPDAVHVVSCPLDKDLSESSDCARWTPVAVHMGWRYCYYLESCSPGQESPRMLIGTTPGFGVYRKWTSTYIEAAQNITFSGHCLKHNALHGVQKSGCSILESTLIHSEVTVYPRRARGKLSQHVINRVRSEWTRHDRHQHLP